MPILKIIGIPYQLETLLKQEDSARAHIGKKGAMLFDLFDALRESLIPGLSVLFLTDPPGL